MYTDPDGEWVWIPFMVAGMYLGGAIDSGTWNIASKEYWQNGWEGAIVGATIGLGVQNALPGISNVKMILTEQFLSKTVKKATRDMLIFGMDENGDYKANNMWKVGVSSGLTSFYKGPGNDKMSFRVFVINNNIRNNLDVTEGSL